MPWEQWLDLNQRPSDYESDKLPDCSTLLYIVPVSFNSVAPTESLFLRPHLFLRGLSPQATYCVISKSLTVQTA